MSQPIALDHITPINPSTLEPLAPVVLTPPSEILKAVTRARAAQVTWSQTPLAERISLLQSAAKEMLRRRAEVAELCHQEMGKVEIEGLFNEGLGPLETVNGWAGVVKQATATRHVSMNPVSFPRKSAEVQYVPRGVIGVIAPWNFPVAGLYRSTIPALMTGNGLVVKPSEFSPRSTAWLVERLAAALPPGLVQVVQGDGRTGAALIEAGIDACVFTGSPRTGRIVRVACAERGIPCSPEMGGKDPAIVLADCDLPRTTAGLTHWSLSNAGQACGAIEIAYVDASIANDLVDRLGRAWSRLHLAPAPWADMGPLANKRQFDIVVAQVEDARKRGATIVCGGAPTGHGLGYQPTLIDHCTPEMSVIQDETFGPVLAIIRVNGVDEAIRSANELRYGLGASIWTSDIARARRLAERLEYGVVNVNNHSFSGALPFVPWSGVRETGYGVANGPESLTTFVRPRTIVVDQLQAPEQFWIPYDESLNQFGQILADAQLGRVTQAWKLPLLWRDRLQSIRKFFG